MQVKIKKYNKVIIYFSAIKWDNNIIIRVDVIKSCKFYLHQSL